MLRYRKTLQLLEQMSFCDTLTGLGNRNRFNRDVDMLQAKHNNPVGIIYLDINGMKQINDDYGHRRGDKTLINAAEKIKQVFMDAHSYRIGGDEFVTICEGVPKEKFLQRAGELRALFNGESEYSVAFGACWSVNSSGVRQLLFETDERMYSDKKQFYHGKALSGRYRHELDDALNLTQPGVLQSMLEAGSFCVYYQPKLAMSSGHPLIGAEALARCISNDGRVISPAQFIPVLEEARLIGALDFYIFDAVCAQISAWLVQGRSLKPISVNFSRCTLSESDFLQRIKQTCARHGAPQHLLEIEVTETVEADSGYDLLAVIHAVREDGFAVSIDDFGVKNANLSLFTTMDFNTLKTDKSLVDDIEFNPKSWAVLSAVSYICKSTGTKLIVEGVETQNQLELLHGIGCDGIQGYLFSEPIAAQAFEEKYLREVEARE